MSGHFFYAWFFPSKVRHRLPHDTLELETMTEQSILEIASRSSKSQLQQHELPAKSESDTDCHIIPRTAMGQSILEIAGSSNESKPQQPVLPAKPPPELLPTQKKAVEMPVSVPLSKPGPWRACQILHRP